MGKGRAFREVTRQNPAGDPNMRLWQGAIRTVGGGLVSQNNMMFWTPYDDEVTQPGGRLFGAWIDAGGRSNSYNEDDAIKVPSE